MMIFRTALCLSLVGIASAAADPKQLVQEQVQPLLDGKAIVGCVVGVIDGGESAVYGFGVTQLGGKTLPDGDTIYEIGSMTKALTGTLLADMVSRGEVALDTPLQELLPEKVTLNEFEGNRILLSHLASQTSGLPRMPDNFAPADPNNPYADYDAEKMYAFLDNHMIKRAPGQYEYSNLGMGVLGHVLARKAGKSYEDLLKERLFAPLKMIDTSIRLTDDQKRRLAPPYDGGLAPAHNWDIDALAGAGAVRSSVNDILKLLAAALSEEKNPVTDALNKAFEPQVGPAVHKRAGQSVGLGWHIAGDGETRWHNGQTGGYASAMFVHRPSRRAVVILSNTSSDRVGVAGEKIMQSLFGMKPAPIDSQKSIQVPAEVLKRYVGVYELVPGARFTITLEDDKLMAQLTGQDAFEVFPSSETEFFYRVVDARLTFVVSGNGAVDKLVLHQGGRDLPATRVK